MPSSATQSASDFAKFKTSACRFVRKTYYSSILTVEASRRDMLHLNYLLMGDDDGGGEKLTRFLLRQKIDADLFFEPVKKSDVRNVAAYVSKFDGIPSRERWSSRTLSLSGNCRSVAQILSSKRMANYAPIVFLAAIDRQMRAFGFDGYMIQREYSQNKCQMLRDISILAAICDKNGCGYLDGYGVVDKRMLARIINRENFGVWKV